MSWRLIAVMVMVGVNCLLPRFGYSLVTHSVDQDLDSDILLRNRHTGAWRVFTMEGMAQVI